MLTHSELNDFRHALAVERSTGRSVGFVPTMGALHAGHTSLLERAVDECEITALSIFVNPMQFGAGEDLDRYPRPLESDLAVAERAGVDHVFLPPVEAIYPAGACTTVRVAELGDEWEGRSRPGHFDGVATVVAKLFALVGECRAYFGEKDWQQLAIVRRLATDLCLPVEVVGCATVRDADGLALSSRNAYLGAEQRAAALALPQALRAGAVLVEDGECNPARVHAVMADVLAREPEVDPQYVAVVDANLRVPPTIEGEIRLVVAAKVGGVRLIDNLAARGAA